jgi:hypothetical protein
MRIKLKIAASIPIVSYSLGYFYTQMRIKLFVQSELKLFNS